MAKSPPRKAGGAPSPPAPDPVPAAAPVTPVSLPTSVANGSTSAPWNAQDAVNGGVLALLALMLLGQSWRRWPDPVIDFGRELYLPWRLSQGAMLYRDVQHLYGPLSQYFNALVFRVLGVGFTTLVAVNLCFYAVILGVIYYLVREGWGRFEAFIASAVFVTVFSFTHILGIGNYNFVTPYAHEVTHGVFIVLMLVLMFRSCLRRPTPARFFAAGVLAGLTVLNKPEAMIAGTGVTLGAVVLLFWKSRTSPLGLSRWFAVTAAFIVGGCVPMLVAVGMFTAFGGLPLATSLRYANNAWLAVFAFSNMSAQPMQKMALGTDDLWGNLLSEVKWGTLAALLALGGGLIFSKLEQPGRKFGWVAFLALIVILVSYVVPWKETAVVLPGLLVLAAALQIGQMVGPPVSRPTRTQSETRTLLWCAGGAFLARMAFNPRYYHYGFFQSALATVVVVASLLAAVPVAVGLGSGMRNFYRAFILVFLIVGAGEIIYLSHFLYSLMDDKVGEGADWFYVFNTKKVDPEGLLIESAREHLVADQDAHSLLVLPEGAMLNYLTRLPSTIPDYMFVPALLANGREDEIVKNLESTPPDRIAVLTRDMREFGPDPQHPLIFGDAPEHGKGLLDFITKNYVVGYQLGDNPLDPSKRGVVIFNRKPEFKGTAPAATKP